MLIPICKIEIKRNTAENVASKWSIDRVHSIRIDANKGTIGDTCEIQLPKNIKWVNYNDIPINRGDDVRVYMGYNDKLNLRFVGKVKDVSAGVPTKITSEDYTFVLRQLQIIKKTYPHCEVGALLKDILPKDIKYVVSGEILIGDYKTTADTVAGEIALLCDNYPISAFFELDENNEPTLYVYSAYMDGRREAGTFSDRQLIISHSLEYQRAEDTKVRIKGISHQTKGKNITYEEGDGDTSTRNYYNLSLDELKKAVKTEISRLKYDGLKGSFTTFGQPVVRKFDVVDLNIEGIQPARYQVKGVTIDFGQNGYRQSVELKRKVVNNG
ncbi:MAG: hypothetical protein LBR17_08440 [Bacteroidales bacterium]|jgi:hypothetical protein|nr:hypothetical protein [Bacteroidales bacterium]